MVNQRVLSLSKSSTLKITALTKQLKNEGKNVINFAAGEPDFDTPAFIKEEAIKALTAGITKYTPSTGFLELREAVAKKIREENNIPCESQNVIVACGAKYAIYTAILTLLDVGDTAIIPAPYWVSYPEMIKLVGGKSKILATSARNNFKIAVKDLKKAINRRTKLLILNYPSNPTGITYSYEELKEIYDVVRDNNIFVLSDEIYEKLLFDGKKHFSFASFPGADKFTITINGFSKAFAMTGWRIGYMVADKKIIEEASKIIDHTTSCISSFSQKAAIVALHDNRFLEEMRIEFQKRRDLLWEGLSGCAYIKPLKPDGTFYMLCDIRKTALSSVDFASQLLEKYLVSCIPADTFGAEGYVRFSFATSSDSIATGIERIKTFLQQL